MAKRKGMLHLLVASFRALPLDLMVPVSRRAFLGIFSRIFSFFSSSFDCFFFSCPPFFSSGFLNPKRAISPALSVRIPSHMRTARAVAGSKCQKKFGTIYHFDVKLMWPRCASRAHLPPRHDGNEAQCAEKKES